jgi:hypothetical protein
LKECENYPLQALPLQALASAYMALGRKEDAAVAETALAAVMKIRGLEIEDLKSIIENPELDLRFRDIKRQGQ